MHLANAVFGDADDQPDVGRVSNERLDQVYRQAYQRDDRPFLQREARRNPEQFLKATERLGVRIPPPMPSVPMPSAPVMSALAPGVGGLVVPSAGPPPAVLAPGAMPVPAPPPSAGPVPLA